MGFSGLRSLVYKVQSRALCFQRMWAAVSWTKQRRAQQSLGQASWSPRKKEEGKLSWGEGRTLSVSLELSPEGLQHIHLYHSLWGYFQDPRKPTHLDGGVLTGTHAPPMYLKPSLHHWYPLLQSKHCKLLCPLLSCDLKSLYLLHADTV